MTETLYDTHGWAWKAYAAYYADGAPSKDLAKAADNTVPAMTENVYDGQGRVTDTIACKFGDEQFRTKTIYEGDRTTVIPPTGGTATTVITDAQGRTTDRLEYTDTARTSSQKTHYTYGKCDEPLTVTDPAGNIWSGDRARHASPRVHWAWADDPTPTTTNCSRARSDSAPRWPYAARGHDGWARGPWCSWWPP